MNQEPKKLFKPILPQRDVTKYPNAQDEPWEVTRARLGIKPLEPGQTLIGWAQNLPVISEPEDADPSQPTSGVPSKKPSLVEWLNSKESQDGLKAIIAKNNAKPPIYSPDYNPKSDSQQSQTTSRDTLRELSDAMKTPEFWAGWKDHIKERESHPSLAFPETNKPDEKN